MTFVELPGYRIKYGKNRALTILQLIGSIPKILIRVKREKAWLARFVADEQPDLVISDNRYGLVVPGVFCIFMTHQLLIRTPFGGLADRLLQRMNYRLIRHFSRCWVPDVSGEGALAGQLSNPRRMPAVPVRYIGWLSRLSRVAVAEEIPILVLLSGPEPQRTLLEQRILRQAAAHPCQMVLVRGLPQGGTAVGAVPAGVVVHDHLRVEELQRVICAARLVIARPGYSTVMDLVRLRRRALLVPTPGQTEQEYLGAWLSRHGWAACVPQNEFSLKEAVQLAEGVKDWPLESAEAQLQKEVLSALAQSRPALG